MTKASKAINLVLISSSMIVAGCYRSQSTTAQDTRAGNRSGAYSGGGYYGVRGGRTVFIPAGFTVANPPDPKTTTDITDRAKKATDAWAGKSPVTSQR